MKTFEERWKELNEKSEALSTRHSEEISEIFREFKLFKMECVEKIGEEFKEELSSFCRFPYNDLNKLARLADKVRE